MGKSRVKGIVVEIGGDTGPLDKALQGTNKNIGSTQSKLKDVERLLKLDPKNTVLLQQKQKLLAEAISETEDKLETLNKANDQVADSVKNYDAWKAAYDPIQAEIDTTTKKLKELKAEQKEMEDCGEVDTDAYRQLTEAVQKTSQELRDLRKQAKAVSDEFGNPVSPEQYDALQREIAETEQNLDGLKDSMKEFGSVGEQQAKLVAEKFHETSEKIAGVGEKITDAGTKMLAVTGSVIAGGTACVTTADSLTSAVNSFISETGAAESDIQTLANGMDVAVDNTERFKDVIEAIYSNNYGESFEDIADAMAKVKTALPDVDDSQLQEITESAIALRDTFDMDVTESIRAVNSMMDQFGVTADEAYSLIVQGAQNGLNQNGDLLDTVNEYSVQFKNAGYGAEEMFNMLANGAESGTWSVDKLGDAVKEFNIRASDGTVGDAIKENAKAFGLSQKEAKALAAEIEGGGVDAYQKLLDKLKQVDDDTQRYQLGVAMFGTMWEDLGENTVYALMSTQGEIAATNDAMADLKEQKYDDLTNQISQLGRTFVSDVAVPIGEKLLPIISQVVDAIAGWLETFGKLSPEGQTTVTIIGAIVAAIGPALIVIGKMVSGFSQAVSGLGDVIDVLGSCWTGVTKAFSGISDGVGSAVDWVTGTALPGLQSGFTTVTDTISSAVGSAVDWVTGTALPGLQSGFTTVMDTISSAVGSAVDWVTGTALPALQTGFTTVIQFIAANPIVILIAAIVALVALIATKGDEIQAVLQKVDDFLQGVFARDWTEVFGPVLGGILNDFFATIKEIWDSIKLIFDGIIDFIRGVFTGDWERAWNGVVEIFEGIFSGLSSILKIPINAVIDLINSAIGGINGLIKGANNLPGVDIPTISKLPKLANGGEVLRGSAIVGEAGPELLTVTGGRTIVQPLTSNTHNRTTHMGGIYVSVYGAPNQDVHELAELVAEEIQQKVDSEEAGL